MRRVEHSFDAAQFAQYDIDMVDIGHLEQKPHLHHAVAMRRGGAGQHVRPLLRQDDGHVAQQVHAVERVQEHLHLERRVLRQIVLPGHLDDTLEGLLEILSVRAVGAVHRHAAAARHEAESRRPAPGCSTATGAPARRPRPSPPRRSTCAPVLFRRLHAGQHRRHLAGGHVACHVVRECSPASWPLSTRIFSRRFATCWALSLPVPMCTSMSSASL